jgi:hypothetical protein
MLLAQKKRHLDQQPADMLPGKKQKNAHQKAPNISTHDKTTNLTLLAETNLVATLDDSQVFRPAAHLAASDVSFVSADKKSGFALHSFVLKLRSPVFAAMLQSLATPPLLCNGSATDEPIELSDSGADLELFFKALYSNNPFALFTGANAVHICKLAHKYACTELLSASYATALKFSKTAILAGGPQPTLPELLLLSQETQNPAILNAILRKVDLVK